MNKKIENIFNTILNFFPNGSATWSNLVATTCMQLTGISISAYRSRSRNRKSPPMSPVRKPSPADELHKNSISLARRRDNHVATGQTITSVRRRKASRSPINARKHTASPTPAIRRVFPKTRPDILPRSKRPPSPPPKVWISTSYLLSGQPTKTFIYSSRPIFAGSKNTLEQFGE